MKFSQRKHAIKHVKDKHSSAATAPTPPADEPPRRRIFLPELAEMEEVEPAHPRNPKVAPQNQHVPTVEGEEEEESTAGGASTLEDPSLVEPTPTTTRLDTIPEDSEVDYYDNNDFILSFISAGGQPVSAAGSFVATRRDPDPRQANDGDSGPPGTIGPSTSTVVPAAIPPTVVAPVPMRVSAANPTAHSPLAPPAPAPPAQAVQQVLDSMEPNLSCPMCESLSICMLQGSHADRSRSCQDLMVAAQIVHSCGHTFCGFCLTLWWSGLVSANTPPAVALSVG